MRRNQRSPEARSWQWLYRTKEWRYRRLHQLNRHPLCERCKSQGKITAATVPPRAYFKMIGNEVVVAFESYSAIRCETEEEALQIEKQLQPRDVDVQLFYDVAEQARIAST